MAVFTYLWTSECTCVDVGVVVILLTEYSNFGSAEGACDVMGVAVILRVYVWCCE